MVRGIQWENEGCERTNTLFYLLRNVRVSDPERARDKGVKTILTSAGKKIVFGEAVFA